jgi:hypothetical protein
VSIVLLRISGKRTLATILLSADVSYLEGFLAKDGR